MSHIATCILETLKADSSVKAIIEDRIYPDALPTDPVLPAIVITHPSEIPDPDSPRQSQDKVRVLCCSNPPDQNGVKDPKEVEQLAQAVKDAIHTSLLQKAPVAVTVNGVKHTISKIRMTGGNRYREPTTDYYVKALDFSVTYRT